MKWLLSRNCEGTVAFLYLEQCMMHFLIPLNLAYLNAEYELCPVKIHHLAIMYGVIGLGIVYSSLSDCIRKLAQHWYDQAELISSCWADG
jgi:hypothetical protein